MVIFYIILKSFLVVTRESQIPCATEMTIELPFYALDIITIFHDNDILTNILVAAPDVFKYVDLH